MRDWSNQGLLYTIQHWEIGKLPSAFVTERMGACTSHLDFDGKDWFVWENEDYTLYVSADGTLLDLDTTASPLEPALKALRWDLRMSDDILPRAEHKSLFKQGQDEGMKYKLEFPCMELPALKQFILDYCDGNILCDHQVRDQGILGMVFLPLVMGAFSIYPPKEGEEPTPVYLALQALTKDIGPEPKRPEVPPAPVKPPYSLEPAPAVGWKTPDPEQVKIIEDDIAWGVAPPERLTKYLEEISLFNVGVDYHHADVKATWEASKKDIDLRHKQAEIDHRRQSKSLDKRIKAFEGEHRTWKLEAARRNALLTGFRAGHIADVALIYENYSKAGPRGVNGYPIFWSFHIVNHTDWERARKAISKELAHREAMEI